VQPVLSLCVSTKRDKGLGSIPPFPEKIGDEIGTRGGRKIKRTPLFTLKEGGEPVLSHFKKKYNGVLRKRNQKGRGLHHSYKHIHSPWHKRERTDEKNEGSRQKRRTEETHTQSRAR